MKENLLIDKSIALKETAETEYIYGEGECSLCRLCKRRESSPFFFLFILPSIICHNTSVRGYHKYICIFRSSHHDYERRGQKMIAEKSYFPPCRVIG